MQRDSTHTERSTDASGLPPICATVHEPTTDAALRQMSRVAPHCSWIELRLDAVVPGALDLERLLANRPRPVVVTCRPEREGGAYVGSEQARLDLLVLAARLGAERIDVEHDAIQSLAETPSATEIIVSRHAFEPVPPETLETLLASVRHPRAAIQKLAVAVTSSEAALDLLQRTGAEAKPTLGIAMGFPGVVSRVAAARWGAPFSYAAADPERPAAPGQLSAARLAGLLAGRTPSRATLLYGVLGHPVDHSRSPDLHNAAFAELGVDAIYTWLDTQDPGAILDAAGCDAGFRGLSVTLPHKQVLLTRGDIQRAREVEGTGALNTLVRTDSGWSAHNTDALAARRLLSEALGQVAPNGDTATENGLRVVVLGSGGAARAVAWAARELGTRVEVYARSETRGREMAGALGVQWGGPLNRVPRDADAVINATPVGMHPNTDASPVAADTLASGAVAYDLVYTPSDTRFLEDARGRRAKIITGLDHFALQARAQLELWLGAECAGCLPEGWLAQRLA